MKTKRYTQVSGFTLVELLVVFLLITLISVILIGLVSHSTALVSLGSQKMITNQKSRSAITKMAPYVATAVPGDNRSAIMFPALKSGNVTNPPYDHRIRFNTTEDFLASNYDPRATPDLSAPSYFIYEFEFIRENPSDPNSLGRIELHRMVAPGNTIDTSVAPRIIAHKVQQFRCLLINSNTIEVRIDTRGTRRGPQGNTYTHIEKDVSSLSVPSQSYQQ